MLNAGKTQTLYTQPEETQICEPSVCQNHFCFAWEVDLRIATSALYGGPVGAAQYTSNNMNKTKGTTQIQ